MGPTVKLLVVEVEFPALPTHDYGRDDAGRLVRFIGDHRPKRRVGP
jgi:hypothetical protein